MSILAAAPLAAPLPRPSGGTVAASVPAPVIDVSGARPEPPSSLPADGGPPLGPNELVPMPATYSFNELLRGLNPLHHLPVVGTIYRAVTGETAPVPERIAVSVVASAFMGGPLGIVATLVGCLAEELLRMGPANSGTPATPSRLASPFDPPDFPNGSG